jgi:predicted ATPase
MFVPRFLAKALNIAEQPDIPLPQTLLEKLTTKQLLLVLDNCEHVLTICAELVKVLLNAPSLKVLVMSREPLGVEGEVRYVVPPLSLPKQNPSFAELSQSEAIKLFVERARSIRPEFALTADNANLIADICRQVDGLPLAIELASARVNVLSLQQLRARLELSKVFS